MKAAAATPPPKIGNYPGKHCSTLEQSKQLKKFGLIHPAPLFVWIKNDELVSRVDPKSEWHCLDYYSADMIGYSELIPAYMVSELTAIIGQNYPSWSFKAPDGSQKWICTTHGNVEGQPKKVNDGVTLHTIPEFDRYADSQAEAICDLLISVIKIDFVKAAECNKRLLEFLK